jgi:isopenicillin N synthase-like dioxygenase
MGQSLPIISIESFATSTPGSVEYDNDSASLYGALSEIGFAIIVGHGVDDKIITDMRNAVRIVFDTPREILMQDMVVKGNYRGFVPLGYFTPNSGKGTADQYEAWKLHNETDPSNPVIADCSLYGQNKWPNIPTDVRTPIMAYWNALTEVSERLIIALCNKMGVDQNILLSYMSDPLTNMTLLNYPPMPPQSDSWGIHPHKDFNLLTLLAHDPIGGLEVRNRNIISSTLLSGNQETIDAHNARLQDDPMTGTLGELGFGTQVLPVSGADIQDEKVLGTCHLATGRDDHLGGDIVPGMFKRHENSTHDDILFAPHKTPNFDLVQVRMKRGDQEEILIEHFRPSEYLLRALRS